MNRAASQDKENAEALPPAALLEELSRLREQQERFRLGLRDSPLNVNLFDEDLCYLWTLNGEAKDYDARRGLSLEQIWPNAEELKPYKALMLQVLKTNREVDFESWFSRETGRVYLKGKMMPYILQNGRKGVLVSSIDYTNIKEAEERAALLSQELTERLKDLMASQTHLQTALQGSPITLFIQNENLEIVWVYNLPESWGREKELLGANRKGQAVERTNREASDELKRQVLADGKPRVYEQWATFPGGVRAFLRTDVTRYELGGKPAIICRSIDLTDVRAAQEELEALANELKESRQRLDVGLRGERFMLYIQDENLRYVWFFNMFGGWQGNDYTGMTDEERGLPEYISRQVHPVKKKVLETGEPDGIALWVENPQGNPFYFRYKFERYTFPSGKLGLIAKVYDLTEEQTQIEEREQMANELTMKVNALQEAEARFATALEGEHITLSIQDEDLRYEWIHNPARGFFKPAELIGKTDQELNLPKNEIDALVEAKRKVLQTGQLQQMENRFTDQEGKERFFSRRIFPYALSNGRKGIISKVYETTETRYTERHLKQLTESLEVEKANLNRTLEKLQIEHDRKIEELNDARTLQLSLLPSRMGGPAELDMAASMRTSLEVGGDYYDYCYNEREFILAIGDATGHGLRSGTMVAMVKSHFQLLCLQMDPNRLLDRVSESMVAMRLHQMYMALSVFRYDGGQFYYATAGMPPMYIARAASGQVETIAHRSLYLGTGLKEERKRLETLKLEPGDVLLLATDGLMETFNPEGKMIPQGQVEATLLEYMALPAAQIVERLVALQKQWQQDEANPEDDTTVLVVKRRD